MHYVLIILLQLHLSVNNRTDRYLGPLQISIIQGEVEGKGGIVINGLWEMVSVSHLVFSYCNASPFFLRVYHGSVISIIILFRSNCENICARSGCSIVGTFYED